jgi:uncharacterized membrane-anchored protein
MDDDNNSSDSNYDASEQSLRSMYIQGILVVVLSMLLWWLFVGY